MDQWLHRGAEFLWSWPTMGLFLFVGLIYTLGLRGIQFRKLPEALRSISSHESGNGMSSYSTLCTALAATIGTGNIVGVATAVGTGGPGALFWMLVAAVLGMGTQFAEGYLAVKYRAKGEKNIGGPFTYMEKGIGKPWLGKMYGWITVCAGILGVGTVTQVNSIAKAIEGLIPEGGTYAGVSVVGAGAGFIVAIFAGLILMGGGKRIVKVCETLVPLMSLLYLFCSFTLLVWNYEKIPESLSLILHSAFCPKAILGAGSGICIRHVIRMGISRGVFTNEAGMGTGAITAASAGESDPVKQGLITMSTTFIDTIVICTISGLCIIVTGAWESSAEGGAMTDLAWKMGLPWNGTLSSYLLVICLVFFAFATVIGWNFYGERCLLYLTGGKGILLYRVGYLMAILLGAFLSVSAVFHLADILNALMALPNLTALLLLRKEVFEDVRKSS